MRTQGIRGRAFRVLQKQKQFKNKNKSVTIIRFCQLWIVGWLSNLFLPVSSSGAPCGAPPTSGAAGK
jgi:hypothetical protein